MGLRNKELYPVFVKIFFLMPSFWYTDCSNRSIDLEIGVIDSCPVPRGGQGGHGPAPTRSPPPVVARRADAGEEPDKITGETLGFTYDWSQVGAPG